MGAQVVQSARCQVQSLPQSKNSIAQKPLTSNHDSAFGNDVFAQKALLDRPGTEIQKSPNPKVLPPAGRV